MKPPRALVDQSLHAEIIGIEFRQPAELVPIEDLHLGPDPAHQPAILEITHRTVDMNGRISKNFSKFTLKNRQSEAQPLRRPDAALARVKLADGFVARNA